MAGIFERFKVLGAQKGGGMSEKEPGNETVKDEGTYDVSEAEGGLVRLDVAGM